MVTTVWVWVGGGGGGGGGGGATSHFVIHVYILPPPHLGCK